MSRIISSLTVTLALTLVTGCGGGLTPGGAAPAGVSARRAAEAPGLRAAFEKAATFARATFGGEFTAFSAHAEQAFDPAGRPREATWRFAMTGKRDGDSGYTFVKINVAPDGRASVPERGGPFPDRNGYHALPAVDFEAVLDPAVGVATVLTEGYGAKYPPSRPITCELRRYEPLKRTVMLYTWYAYKTGDHGARDFWMVQTALDPVTGEVAMNHAVKTPAP